MRSAAEGLMWAALAFLAVGTLHFGAAILSDSRGLAGSAFGWLAAGAVLMAVSMMLYGDWFAASMNSAGALIAADVWRKNRRNRRKRRSLLGLAGEKSRALIAALVRTLRDATRPRPRLGAAPA